MNAQPSPPPNTLFLPGPTQVADEILAEMARPAIGHRGAAIQDLVDEVESRLQRVLGTEDPVLLCSCSATPVLEAAVRNTVADGKVLHLVCGAFSEKWEKWSRANGKNTSALHVEWGTGFDPAVVAAELRREPYAAVTVTHNETSTGVLNPLREIAAAVREASPDTLVLVDAVSSLSAVEIPFAEWGLDVMVASVQKALALPPGFAVAAVSQRALKRAESVPHRGSYLDFIGHVKMLEKRQTVATPSTAHLYALRRQLERIEAETLAARAERHRDMATRTQEFARANFRLYTDERFLSPTVTVLKLPAPHVPAELIGAMRGQGIELGSGYGALKGSTFRIGHMGEHTPQVIDDLLARIASWIKSRA